MFVELSKVLEIEVYLRFTIRKFINKFKKNNERSLLSFLVCMLSQILKLQNKDTVPIYNKLVKVLHPLVII